MSTPTDFEALKQRELARIARIQKVCDDYTQMRKEMPNARKYTILRTMANAYHKMNSEAIARGEHLDNPYALLPSTDAGIRFILEANGITE